MKALADRAKLLRQRQARAFGELVIACGADALEVEVLAGALLDAANRDDLTVREEWRVTGAAFFRTNRRSGARPRRGRRGASPDEGGAQPAAGDAGAP